MPAKTSVQRHIVAVLAAKERWDPDSPDIPPLRAELATEALAEHIAEVVASAPPLTSEQADRLRSLLPGPGR